MAIRGHNPTHEPPEHRYEGRNCGDHRCDPVDPVVGLMPAIFYLSLPPVETATATNRFSQPDTSHAAEPHPFDDVIDRVTAATGSQASGPAGTERRNG